ncbi:MAG: FMN-binding protein [Prevotella sp.]
MRNIHFSHSPILTAAAVLLLSSFIAADAILTKDGKTTVVNTTSLTSNVRGFRGPTPLKIYIKSNKIQKIETLPNQESPKFFAKAKAVLAQFEGKSVSKVEKLNVDAKTGATFSTKALIQNVKQGVKYYKEHK